jgi:hypothetical protein
MAIAQETGELGVGQMSNPRRVSAATILVTAAVVVGLIALTVLVATALINPDAGQRVAAATGAATIVLALIAAGSMWQNFRLVAAAADQAEASRTQAESSRQVAQAAADQAAASMQQAVASERLAEAAGRQAKASFALVEEARSDRELEFQPVVTVRLLMRGDHGGRRYAQVTTSNVGRGAALRVAIAYHEFVDPGLGHLFGSFAQADLGPDQRDTPTIYLGTGASDQADRRLIDDLPEPGLAAGYEDVVGNRYRWVATPSGHGRLEVWRRGAANQPEWSRW